jgi:hypothetical protein
VEGLIDLGLVVVLSAAVLWLVSRNALALGVLLAAASAWLWIVWAHNEYSPLDGCPWDRPTGTHPVLIGLALCGGSAAVMAAARWTRGSRALAVGIGVSVGLAAGVLILVGSFFVGASLHCTD